MVVDKKETRARVAWSDLVELSQERAWGGLHDYTRLGWFRAHLRDEALFGTIEGHVFRSGLRVFMADLWADNEVEMSTDQTEPTLGFCLAIEGSCIKKYEDGRKRTSEIAIKPGVNISGSTHGKAATVIFEGGRLHQIVTIRLPLANYSEYPANSGEQAHRPDTSPLASGYISSDNKLMPTLEHAARQLHNCRYAGAARRLFVEAKALEILASRLNEFSTRDTVKSMTISPADRQRLEQARAVLDREFADPPSLIALAHRVGLNDCKLKRGFREAFGMTVFGYVRQLRMEEARRLIESTDLSITEVALAVGHYSFGHFSAAFKRSFGVVPSRYRKM